MTKPLLDYLNKLFSHLFFFFLEPQNARQGITLISYMRKSFTQKREMSYIQLSESNLYQLNLTTNQIQLLCYFKARMVPFYPFSSVLYISLQYYSFLSFFFLVIFIFGTIFKVTLHLQLSQNIGYIPCAVQYLLESTLHPVLCTSHSPIPILLLTSHW